MAAGRETAAVHAGTWRANPRPDDHDDAANGATDHASQADNYHASSDHHDPANDNDDIGRVAHHHHDPLDKYDTLEATGADPDPWRHDDGGSAIIHFPPNYYTVDDDYFNDEYEPDNDYDDDTPPHDDHDYSPADDEHGSDYHDDNYTASPPPSHPSTPSAPTPA